MKAILLSLFLLPLSLCAQQPRPLMPHEMRPDERYVYMYPLSYTTDRFTGECLCMAVVLVWSTGEQVQVRLSCEDCQTTMQGEIMQLLITRR